MLNKPLCSPSIEIGNCIAVQVCMLQIPILVLFTIFYVSSPRTGPVTPTPLGRSHNTTCQGHNHCPPCPLPSAQCKGKWIQMSPTPACAIPCPRDVWRGFGCTQVSNWGWQRTVLAGHKGTTLSILQPTNFTLVFSDLHVYASMFSVVLMNYIFMDGKCDYFQGQCGSWCFHCPCSNRAEELLEMTLESPLGAAPCSGWFEQL